MAKISYIDKDFRESSLQLIFQANEIIDEYFMDGMRLTLRQLYYQFVARGLIPNKQSEYKRLGNIISDARLAGLIDWMSIEDRTRGLKRNSHWTHPGEIIRSAWYGFQLDHWEDQPHHVEVWIEKEALVGVISDICRELDVSYFACKGYVSQSEMWSAAQRLEEHKMPVIIHLGDHDPSGIDMTRDIQDRHDLFLGSHVHIDRIALNMDQVEEFNPPPNPAKLTDSRCDGYITNYGRESWELDALEPRYLKNIISETVRQYRDDDIYNAVLEREREYKAILKRVEENWETL